ncbi:MAG: flagellar basal body P-ring protein FlgI [Planctomycetota bacterium]
MPAPRSFVLLGLAAALNAATFTPPAGAGGRTALRNICRVKGQEENTLNGLGLVVGLNGTGEAGDGPTMRNLARAMELMGSPVSQSGRLDAESLQELRNIKNVALVMVSATVPATGARRGDKLDCHVSAINGKSLEGGRLAFASLRGPNTQDGRVFALCQGSLVIDDPAQPMVARIHGGCQMQQDVFTPFVKDGYITLVLDENHADFQIADAIVHQIRDTYGDQVVKGDDADYDAKLQQLVQAINASNVRVKVPEFYTAEPVAFAAELLEIDIYDAEPEARVYINSRTGSIQISGDVEIGDVVVAHRNLVVEATAPAKFASVDPGETNKPKLTRLITALESLRVPADDIVEIIRGINKLGKLHARLMID